MAELVDVPIDRVPAEALNGLLQEFASRDGTDYGLRETPLEQRVEQLQRQLKSRHLRLLFDVTSEQWDLVNADDAERLLAIAERDE